MKKRFLPLLFYAMTGLVGLGCGEDWDFYVPKPISADCPPAPPAEGTVCQTKDDCGPEGACFIAACVDGGCVSRTRRDGVACFECEYEGTCQAGVCEPGDNTD